jgi:hypothetical protein
MILLYKRPLMRRASALFTLLLVAAVLLGAQAGKPGAVLSGSGQVYLPIIRAPGTAKIDVTTELNANSIVARGDRIWVQFDVRNQGSAETTMNTAINLPSPIPARDWHVS